MDNCGGHNESPEQQYALQQLNAVIRKLSKFNTFVPCLWLMDYTKNQAGVDKEVGDENNCLFELSSRAVGPYLVLQVVQPCTVFFKTGC